jgi:hypothetical protein
MTFAGESTMRRLVICVAVCVLSTSVQAFESAWVWLASYRILEPSCRPDIQLALKGLSTSDLEEAVEIARQRELVFTSKVKTAGDAARAQKELDDYYAVMVAQHEAGLKTMGCAKAIQKLGLNLPKPMTREQITTAARSVPISSSERTDAIPAIDRVGTKAAYQLQKIITQSITQKKNCDPTSLRVTLLNEVDRTPRDAPPFVGMLRTYSERWEVVCNGETEASIVTFHQDARKWRSYKIEHGTRTSASNDASQPEPALRKGLPN